MNAVQQRAVTLIGVLVACAGGCASQEEPADEAALRNRTFLLQSSEGFQPVAGTTVVLYFSEKEGGFRAGCNSHYGMYQVSGGVLSFSHLSSNLVACSTPLVQQDAWLSAFLRAGPRLTLIGNDLALRSSTATLVFLDRVVADPDRPLVGTPWTVNSYITDGIAGGYAKPKEPTFAFGADGRVDVETTCNTGVGTFGYGGATLTLKSMQYTDNPCDAAKSAVDQYLRGVLADGELTVKIVAAQLTLMRGEQGVTARGP